MPPDSPSSTRLPLVLVHGFTAGPSAWDPVLPALVARFDVHALTLDGHRAGAKLAGEPTISGFADSLEHQLDDRGLRTAHLVGNSLGGWLSLVLAGRHRAESVVALAPAGGWRPGGSFERRVLARFFAGYAAAMVAPHALEGLVRRPRSRRMFLDAMVARPDRVSASAAVEVAKDLAGCAAMGPFLRNPRCRDFAHLAAIDVPVLIAWGAEDRILRGPAARERFADLVPHADVIELAGVGHVPMSDAPELVAQTICDFVSASARRPDGGPSA